MKLIRWKVIPQKDEFSKLFLLTSTGNQFTKVSETVRNIGLDYDIVIPTAGLHRKVIATQAYESVDDSTMRKLNMHMNHSAATSSLYYQHPHQKQAINIHSTTQNLRAKRYFGTEEDQHILREYPLDNNQTPTLEICQPQYAEIS